MNWRVKTGANVVFFSIVCFASVVIINLLASRVFFRADLTEQKMFTLSQASKDVVGALPDRLTVKAFLSSQAELANATRYVRDLLAEYQTYSNGKLTFEVLDPANDPVAKQEAERLKVTPVRLQQMASSKFSVEQAYLGLGFQFGGEIESIPVINPNQQAQLEYEITSLIKRLTQRKRKVAFASGHGEATQAQGLSALAETLKHYDLGSVDLKSGGPIPDDVDALLIVGPTEPFDAASKAAIDAFLMKGKSAAFLLDGMVMETPRGQMPPGMMPPQIARPNQVGLDDLLAAYGIKVENDSVMDEQNVPVVMMVAPGQMAQINYPGFPVITDLDRTNPAVGPLRSIIPVFPSSITILDNAKQGGAQVQILAKTTPRAWKQTEIILFDPNNQPQPKDERGAYPVAVAIKGNLKSYAAARPVDAAESAEPDAPVQASARLVVIGDSEFIKDETIRKLRQMATANFTFMVNLIDWMAQDEALIALRSKGETSRPLDEVPAEKITVIKYANAIGVPLALILFGIVRWRLRRAARARLKLR